MLIDFLKHNPDCLIVCPSFYHSFLGKIRKNDSLAFSFASLEEIEELVKDHSRAEKAVDGRSIYILHYDCGQRISELLGEISNNMSISYFPKAVSKEIDESTSSD